MHQHAAGTDDCAKSHHGADLDARADLDTHGGTNVDPRANMDAGPNLHAHPRADVDTCARADGNKHANSNSNSCTNEHATGIRCC